MDIESETANIQEFVNKGNYHAAMNLAISALNECRRNGDRAGIDAFLKLVQSIVDTLSDEFGNE